MKTTATLLALAVTAVFTSTAQAETPAAKGQGERPNPAQMFEKLDTDGSNTISKDEAGERLGQYFDKIDTDGDGELSKDELAKGRKQGQRQQGQKQGSGERGERFKASDTDGNGALSKAEAEAAGAERLLENFDKIDANGDGELSIEELKNSRPKKGKGKGKGQKGGKPEVEEPTV